MYIGWIRFARRGIPLLFILISSLFLGGLSLADVSPKVEMSPPIPMQLGQNCPEKEPIFAEDLVSILHPIASSWDNFKSKSIEILTGEGKEEERKIGDFVLTPGAPLNQTKPGLTQIQPEQFYIDEHLKGVQGVGVLRPRSLYISDVRDKSDTEKACTKYDPQNNIVYRDSGQLSPYKDLFPNLPWTADAPALAISKVKVKVKDENGERYDILVAPQWRIKPGADQPYGNYVFVLRLDGPSSGSSHYKLSEVVKANLDKEDIFRGLREIFAVEGVYFTEGQEKYDILVLGRDALGRAVVRRLTKGEDGWQVSDIDNPLLKTGPAWDASVMTDIVNNDEKREYFVVPMFREDKKDENYKVLKIGISGSDNNDVKAQEFSLGRPTFITAECETRDYCEIILKSRIAKPYCGPVRIKCTRDGYVGTGDKFDLNLDGWGDCVMTWGKINDFDEDSRSSITLFRDFTVYASDASKNPISYSLREYSINPQLPLKQDRVTPQAFAVEISDANLDSVPDVWIGDQQMYKSGKDVADVYVSLFRNETKEIGNLFFEEGDIQYFKSNYGIDTGGVKAIAADEFGNIGVINGTPYPACERPLRRGVNEPDWAKKLDEEVCSICNFCKASPQPASQCYSLCTPEITYAGLADYLVTEYSALYEEQYGNNDKDGDCIPDCLLIPIPMGLLIPSYPVDPYQEIGLVLKYDEDAECQGCLVQNIKQCSDSNVNSPFKDSTIDDTYLLVVLPKSMDQDGDCIPDCGYVRNIQPSSEGSEWSKILPVPCDTDLGNGKLPTCCQRDKSLQCPNNHSLKFDLVDGYALLDENPFPGKNLDGDCIPDCVDGYQCDDILNCDLYFLADPECQQNQSKINCSGIKNLGPSLSGTLKSGLSYPPTIGSNPSPISDPLIFLNLEGGSGEINVPSSLEDLMDEILKALPEPGSINTPDNTTPPSGGDSPQGGSSPTSFLRRTMDLIIPPAYGEGTAITKEKLQSITQVDVRTRFSDSIQSSISSILGNNPPLPSEPTVLINKTAFCILHPNDPSCKEDICKTNPSDPSCQTSGSTGSTGGPIGPTGEPQLSVPECVVDVDRGAIEDNEYKKFREYVRSLNDRYREMTGLKTDIFIPEYVGRYSARLYVPAARLAVVKAPQIQNPANAVGAKDILATIDKAGGARVVTPIYYSGMKLQNYQVMERRPVWSKNMLKDAVVLPQKEMLENIQGVFDINPSSVASDIKYENPYGSHYVLGGTTEIAFLPPPEGAVQAELGNSSILTSPAIVAFQGVAGLDGCAWAAEGCDDPVPPDRKLDPEAILNIVEKKVESIRSKGGVVTPDIINEALKEERWDKTGYLEMHFDLVQEGSSLEKMLSSNLLFSETSAKSISLPPAGETGDKFQAKASGDQDVARVVASNIADMKEKGAGCTGLTLLVVPMELGVSGSSCNCNIMKRGPQKEDILALLIGVSSLALLYFIRLEARRRS